MNRLRCRPCHTHALPFSTVRTSPSLSLLPGSMRFQRSSIAALGPTRQTITTSLQVHSFARQDQLASTMQQFGSRPFSNSRLQCSISEENTIKSADDGILDAQSKQQQHRKQLPRLAQSVEDAIHQLLLRQHNHFEDIDGTMVLPIVVAVSGGCDSMALFHALLQWRDHHYTLQENDEQQSFLELDVTVVHFHHQQRPIEADADCKLVRDQVEKANLQNVRNSNNKNTTGAAVPAIRFLLKDWNDIAVADSSPSFSQDAAREWRRTVLRDCAQQLINELCNGSAANDSELHSKSKSRYFVPCGVVLTAHHDDDSYETVLLKLLRGVHLLNLHDKATIARIAPMSVNRSEGDASLPFMDSTTTNKECKKDTKIGKCSTTTLSTPPIYLVRPFVSDSTTKGHTKDELIQFLKDRNLEWREDASNHDPNSKYLRNRVRNELIPLLKDLSDDSFQTKRISALLQQSKDLSDDLYPRVEAYLEAAVSINDASGSKSFFRLLRTDSSDNSSNRLVQSQALYQWMSGCVQPDIIPYESLQRIVKQLEDYPKRKQWTLELGCGWCVHRLGNVLRVDKNAGENLDPSGCTDNQATWSWVRLPRDDGIDHSNPNETIKDNTNTLQIRFPMALLEGATSKESLIEFSSTTLRELEGITIKGQSENDGQGLALRFHPSWRNSPVKLRAFLRGQGVPVHLRDTTELLVSKHRETHTTESVVAVYVKSRWIVDKTFHMDMPANEAVQTGAYDTVVLELSRKH